MLLVQSSILPVLCLTGGCHRAPTEGPVLGGGPVPGGGSRADAGLGEACGLSVLRPSSSSAKGVCASGLGLIVLLGVTSSYCSVVILLLSVTS